eukprot:TRINITY_DN16656_c0_g1_i1.p1 TRINITY_DN16656_c0_g1~~TRINITY_DN16656_c0_g1_i1.p1  ORF type:complete len:442 (-),score=105.71 TRINITY_DN16656_c0_g1_i1:260-1585(-)
MIRRPPRSTLSSSSAASDVYKRQPFPPPPDMGRKAPKGAMTGGKPQPNTSRGPRGGNTNDFMNRATTADSVATMVDEGSMDATTSNVIHSPVFVAFRQHVLNDISERIASARSTQSSDIDVELLALRNDIRHRVTSSRVVELIKQYSDTETPHRVTQLFRLVKELEGEKVSVLDLNDGLRSKADAHILDTKANIEYVDSIAKRLTQRLDALQADLSILINDRKEYREVVQQLLLQTQQLRQGRPNNNNNANNLVSGVFPPIGGGGVGGAQDGGGELSMSTFGENGTGGGGATRTFAGGKQNHPGGLVPLTELLHARHAGGPMVGAVIHSPSPPLPLLHKPDIDNPSVMPVTESQQGYASAIATEKQQHRGTVGSSLGGTSRSPQPPPPQQSTSDKKSAFSSPSMTYPVPRQSAESAAPIPFTNTNSKAPPQQQQSPADRAL